MKKIFAMAAIFAATMMSFTACGEKEEKPDGGKVETPADVCPDCQKNPCECEPEYVSPITIDGDFSDWSGLAGVVESKCAADAKYTALKSVKVYADAVYINILLEVDLEQLGDLSYNPLDIYLDQDGEDGAGDDYYIGQTGVDYLFEAAFIAEGAFVSYDPGMFEYTGSREAWEWGWNPLLPEASGIATGAGKDNKYELAILKEMLMGAEVADTFGLGVMVATPDWATVGVIPNVDVTDDNANGKAPLLKVATVK